MTLTYGPIHIDQESAYRQRLASCPQASSDYSFVNLWSWADVHGLEWAWQDDLVWILQRKDNALTHWAPIGDWKTVDWQQQSENLTAMGRFDRVPEQLARQWQALPSAPRQVVSRRGHWDYLYDITALATLPGNRFHKKKNLLNQFLKKNEFHYEAVGPELVGKILELQENWCEIKRCEEDSALLDEDRAVYEALKHMDVLQFHGGAIVIEGKVAAFSLGEMLNSTTAVIHIEKGDPSITGIYAAMNKLFCENAWSKATFINREQDLGIEGLRKAKLSYNPHHLVIKYTLMKK